MKRFASVCLAALAAVIVMCPGRTLAQDTLFRDCGENDLIAQFARIALHPVRTECMPKLADLYCRANAGQSTLKLVEQLQKEGCMDQYSRILPLHESWFLQALNASQPNYQPTTSAHSNLKVGAGVIHDRVPGIQYLAIHHFGTLGTYEKAYSVLAAMEQTDKLILDLRSSPGGMFDEMIGLAGLFAPGRGALVMTDRTARDSQPYYAQARGMLHGRQTLILVDGRTASAGEMLAAYARQANPIGVRIMGRQTFGKSAYQMAYFPPERHVEVSVTVGEVIVGNGKWPTLREAHGVIPDYILTEEFMRDGSYSLVDRVVRHGFDFFDFHRMSK